MPNSSLYINQIDIDDQFYVWGSGQSLRRFNGSTWEYYDSTNSAVPQSGSYYLDTRSISIDNEEILWCGVAQGPTSGLSDVAIFNIDTNRVENGKSWNFSDLGDFQTPQEISLVFACDFGDDVLAFSTPLNGTGTTGPSGSYTRINGVTGGRLFSYDKNIDKWKEKVEGGYIWPRVYSIKAKGIDGDRYSYYIGTSEGLFVLPEGQYTPLILNDGTKIIEQAIVYNTYTSKIISDIVYSLDFDEIGNVWIGTDKGLSYFDGYEFWNFGTSGPVTLLKSRKNGHVFYSMGDGEIGQGTGLWHFNGYSHTQHNSSNSDLSNDNVLGISLIESNIEQSGLELKENSLWVLGYNSLDNLDYDIPHVYGSSKYEGATGWNFVYLSSTGGSGPYGVPKLNKYTWDYPEWRSYDDSFLKYKHPGLDDRNLFLTTKLEDIATGIAGTQSYWDNPPIESYEQKIKGEKIQLPEWFDPVLIDPGATGNPNSNGTTLSTQDSPLSEYLRITCSTTIEEGGKTIIYIGGYLRNPGRFDKTKIKFGNFKDGSPSILENANPSLGGSYDGRRNYMGFVVSYLENGIVQSIIPFKGYSTFINSLSPSEDRGSVVVSGCYNWLIENGPFVYSGSENFNQNFATGGAPVGITNLNFPGATSGNYPWIYSPTGGTGSTYFSSPGYEVFNISFGLTGSSGYISFLDFEGNIATTFDEIEFIVCSYINSSSSDISSELQNVPMGYVITLGDNLNSNLYGYYTILSNRSNPFPNGPINQNVKPYTDYPSNTVIFGVSFRRSTGGPSNISSVPTSISICVYTHSNLVYPLVPSLFEMVNLTNITFPEVSPGVFVCEIQKNLGNITSFSDIDIDSDYDETIKKSYRIKNFRNFPSVISNSSAVLAEGSVFSASSDFIPVDLVKCDVSSNYVNMLISYSSTCSGFSTLKNKWVRDKDSFESSEILVDLNGKNFISYVSLNIDDFSLKTTRTSLTTSTQEFGIDGSKNDIKSLFLGSTCLITGNSSPLVNFTFGGIDFTHPSSSFYRPYYIILDTFGNGVTGGYIDNKYDFPNKPSSISISKNSSSYFINTIYSGSSTPNQSYDYLGNKFFPGASGAYSLISKINEIGITEKFFYNLISEDPDLGFYAISSHHVTKNENHFIFYNDIFYSLRFLKLNSDGFILDRKFLGYNVIPYKLNSVSVSEKSDFYISTGCSGIRLKENLSYPICGITYEGFGYLYNWYTIGGNSGRDFGGIVNTSQPYSDERNQWIVPTSLDFEKLMKYVGIFYPGPISSSSTNGSSLKTKNPRPLSTGYGLWLFNSDATNSKRWSGVPGGERSSFGSSANIGTLGKWWSSTTYGPNPSQAANFILTGRFVFADLTYNTSKGSGFSIRLVRQATEDEMEIPDGTTSNDTGILPHYIGNSNRKYIVVKIGEQIWTTQNLIDDKYNDGSDIIEITSDPVWASLTTGARCSYDNGTIPPSIGGSIDLCGIAKENIQDILPESIIEDGNDQFAFVLKIKQYAPELGINLGDIISRPGSGAWTWCDVHSSDKNLEVPLMSTVVFNNYSSNIYGKKNNVWILSDSSTGEEILNIKGTPYFIYTFSAKGYYQIYNSIEDSFGNVYEVSLPAFIRVIDHKEKRDDDPKPFFVDSTDYGYLPRIKVNTGEDIKKLSESLLLEQKKIVRDNSVQFGTEFTIPYNPDSTFSGGSD